MIALYFQKPRSSAIVVPKEHAVRSLLCKMTIVCPSRRSDDRTCSAKPHSSCESAPDLFVKVDLQLADLGCKGLQRGRRALRKVVEGLRKRPSGHVRDDQAIVEIDVLRQSNFKGAGPILLVPRNSRWL